MTPMNATFEPAFTGLFDQAASSFGEALKTGVKFQEDFAKYWSDVMDKTGPLAEVQKRSLSTMKEVVPVAQKNVEDLFRVVDENYRRGLELMKKSLEAKPTDSMTDVQARAQKLWEGSIELLKDSTQGLTHANIMALENFAEMMRKSVDGALAAVAAVSKPVSQK